MKKITRWCVEYHSEYLWKKSEIYNTLDEAQVVYNAKTFDKGDIRSVMLVELIMYNNGKKLYNADKVFSMYDHLEYQHLVSRSVVYSNNIKREWKQALDHNGVIYHIKL